MNERELWERSGGLALTGRPGGRGLHGPGRPASVVQHGLDRIAALHPDSTLPGVELLGERAAVLGLGRNGPWSCTGSFRVLRTLDGWLGISLARPSDLAQVPVLLKREVGSDPWGALSEWASVMPTWVATHRLGDLDLAGGPVPEPRTPRPGVVVTPFGARHEPDGDRPLVVDLTRRWAGPLCARLLADIGARVITVDRTDQPDLDRVVGGPFYQGLHRGRELLLLDFETELPTLRALVRRADLVVTTARTHELRQVGLTAEMAVRGGTSWISITARGRDSTAFGYGDDVAAAAGHVIRDGPDLLPVGDALAEPLAGVAAAVAGAEALAAPEARLVDVSMFHVAAEAL